jgi:hypothetical protein
MCPTVLIPNGPTHVNYLSACAISNTQWGIHVGVKPVVNKLSLELNSTLHITMV